MTYLYLKQIAQHAASLSTTGINSALFLRKCSLFSKGAAICMSPSLNSHFLLTVLSTSHPSLFFLPFFFLLFSLTPLSSFFFSFLPSLSLLYLSLFLLFFVPPLFLALPLYLSLSHSLFLFIFVYFCYKHD